MGPSFYVHIRFLIWSHPLDNEKHPHASHLSCMRVFYSKALVQLIASAYVTISSVSITAELRTIGGGKGGIRTHARLATPS